MKEELETFLHGIDNAKKNKTMYMLQKILLSRSQQHIL